MNTNALKIPTKAQEALDKLIELRKQEFDIIFKLIEEIYIVKEIK